MSLDLAVRISVVIPSFNDADFLADCLAGLAAQTRPADEIIVVDNASTDATADVARAAGATVVYQPVQGIWPAVAAGYDAASGDIIARLDADSIPSPDWLARIEQTLGDDPLLDAVTGTGDFYGCSPVVAWFGQSVYLAGYFHLMRLWLGHFPVFGSNFAMRRQLWLTVASQVHRNRADVHDDLDLSLHFNPTVSVSYDPELVVLISGRPFDSFTGFARRVNWGSRTLRLHTFRGSPVIRHRRRLLHRLSRRSVTTAG